MPASVTGVDPPPARARGRGASARGADVPLPLGELQAAVLRDLWRHGESPVRDVGDRLRAGGAELAYTTVLTVMVRLAQRGLLVRRREGRRDLYRAAVAPE